MFNRIHRENMMNVHPRQICTVSLQTKKQKRTKNGQVKNLPTLEKKTKSRGGGVPHNSEVLCLCLQHLQATQQPHSLHYNNRHGAVASGQCGLLLHHFSVTSQTCNVKSPLSFPFLCLAPCFTVSNISIMVWLCSLSQL